MSNKQKSTHKQPERLINEPTEFIRELKEAFATTGAAVILVVIDQSTTTYIDQHGRGNANTVDLPSRRQPPP